MKLLFKSIYLFLLGVYAECYKKRFDYVMDKTIKNGGNIASVSPYPYVKQVLCALYAFQGVRKGAALRHGKTQNIAS